MEMSYQDHFKTCPYCNKGLVSKPTITVKSASSADKRRKLIELGHLIRGIPVRTKGAYASKFDVNIESPMESRSKSKPGTLEKAYKLKELRKLISG
jgi:hypothetical protein